MRFHHLGMFFLAALLASCGEPTKRQAEGGAGSGGAGAEGGTGGGGAGGEAGTGGAGGEGGTGGTSGNEAHQYVDQEGLCRTTAAFEKLGCPPTWSEALTMSTCSSCAGTCGAWLAVRDTCTPSLGCTYDPDTKQLVGVVFGGDTPDYCDFGSYNLIYGDGAHGCRFTYESDEGCPHFD